MNYLDEGEDLDSRYKVESCDKGNGNTLLSFPYDISSDINNPDQYWLLYKLPTFRDLRSGYSPCAQK